MRPVAVDGRQEGRTAIVTGAARGIGFGIARRLLEEGANVTIADVGEAALEGAMAELPPELGARAFPRVADVSLDAEVERLVADTAARFGSLDILVNNAGISPKHEGRTAPVADMDPAEWRRVLDVNLTGAFLCARACIPHMRKVGWGRIVNIASQAGRTRSDIAGAHYAASKAGMIGLARTLAGEVGRDGITVNSIAPGRIMTPMAAEAGAAVNEAYLTRIPVARLGTVEDIAGAVAYLASDEAGFVTGVAFDVNGGVFMV
ncbi:MAG: SDR family oxidoreductase [Alphaproteobacteria bacterium]|nr:SDR family oxidoreductase [Alphaproteobacteria bacterium]MDX5369828.1 SDR family oxidoreductase [Alphaproteobacteria bacterium]